MKATYIIALAVGFIACVTDLKDRRIPNVLTLGAAAGALVFHAVSGHTGGLAQAVAGWFVGAAIFFVPFALGGLGGGDVKLLAALGAWIGPVDAVWMGLYTGIAGGVLALLVAASAGYLSRALSNVWLLFSHWRVAGIRPVHEVRVEGSSGPRLASAIPVFVGMLMTIWSRS
jgi:prepilin peptidase CpaA